MLLHISHDLFLNLVLGNVNLFSGVKSVKSSPFLFDEAEFVVYVFTTMGINVSTNDGNVLFQDVTNKGDSSL